MDQAGLRDWSLQPASDAEETHAPWASVGYGSKIEFDGDPYSTPGEVKPRTMLPPLALPVQPPARPEPPIWPASTRAATCGCGASGARLPDLDDVCRRPDGQCTWWRE